MNRTAQVCRVGFLLFLVAGLPALSQYGRLPGGNYPQGRGGVGLPSPVPGGGRQPGTQKDKSAQQPLPNFTGVLRGSSSKTLTLEQPEGNTLEFRCSKKTRYYNGSKNIKFSVLKSGDHLSVEARRSPDGTLDAVNVRLEREKQ